MNSENNMKYSKLMFRYFKLEYMTDNLDSTRMAHSFVTHAMRG